MRAAVGIRKNLTHKFPWVERLIQLALPLRPVVAGTGIGTSGVWARKWWVKGTDRGNPRSTKRARGRLRARRSRGTYPLERVPTITFVIVVVVYPGPPGAAAVVVPKFEPHPARRRAGRGYGRAAPNGGIMMDRTVTAVVGDVDVAGVGVGVVILGQRGGSEGLHFNLDLVRVERGGVGGVFEAGHFVVRVGIAIANDASCSCSGRGCGCSAVGRVVYAKTVVVGGIVSRAHFDVAAVIVERRGHGSRDDDRWWWWWWWVSVVL